MKKITPKCYIKTQMRAMPLAWPYFLRAAMPRKKNDNLMSLMGEQTGGAFGSGQPLALHPKGAKGLSYMTL